MFRSSLLCHFVNIIYPMTMNNMSSSSSYHYILLQKQLEPKYYTNILISVGIVNSTHVQINGILYLF